MNPNGIANQVVEDQSTYHSHAALIRDEGRQTRSVIRNSALVVIGFVIFSPFLYVAAPVFAVLLGCCFIAAFSGAILGKLISRRRERGFMREIRFHHDRVVSIRPGISGRQGVEKASQATTTSRPVDMMHRNSTTTESKIQKIRNNHNA